MSNTLLLDEPVEACELPCRLGARFSHSLSVYVGSQLRAAPVRWLSPTGLGLMLERPAESGDILSVELPNRGSGPWRLKMVRVTHVRRLSHDTWFVGGTFLQRLTPADFRAVLGLE